MEDKKKISKCRYQHPYFKDGKIVHYCVVDGWEDENVKNCNEQECEECSKFDSRYIEYPLTIQGIENETIDNYGLHNVGCLCEIRPCGEEYKDKSYIGIYLGDLPIQILSSYDRTTGILKNSTMNNPAIFVPELRKIIYGCESWWREIETIEDFKGITDEDIDNIWYVKLLKSFESK